jgi:hypothetical protein
MNQTDAYTEVKPAVRLWPAAVWLAATVVLSFLVYHDLLKSPFFLDDYIHLHLIKKLQHPFEPFYTDIFMGAFFRPALTVFWAIDYALWGTNASGFYAMNLVYLLISAVLLYAILHNLTGSHALAGLTTLFYSLGPVTGVGVQWLSNRFDLLGALFFLASTLLFLRFVRYRHGSDYWLSLFLAVIAFFCKEITITLPAVLVIAASFMFLYRAPHRFDYRLVKRIVSYSTPFFMAAAVYLVWRYLVIHSLGGYTGEAKEPFSLGYFFFLWHGFGEYVWIAVNPFVVAVVLLLVALLLAKTNFYAHNKLFFFGLTLAVITLVPLALILKYRAVMAYMTPRFFFLPNIGVIIALVAVYDPHGSRGRKVVAGVLLTILGLAMALNNYILVHKWYRDKTKLVAKMEKISAAVADHARTDGSSAMVYACFSDVDVALDTAVKLAHPEFADRYFFLKCAGPTQTVATRDLYEAKRRLLNFPASFARNPCTYDDLVYGVVETQPRQVLQQSRTDPTLLVLEPDKDGNLMLLNREQLITMLKARFGIDQDADATTTPDKS